MRLAAALTALFICVFEGLRRNFRMKRRAEFLGEIVAMLGSFSAEIKFRAPTLDELIARENGRFAALVREHRENSPDVRAAWEKACSALPQKDEETTLLKELGRSLVGCGSDGAASIISLYAEKFSRLEKNAREEYSRKGAAELKIFALGGLAAAVLIV